MKSSSFLKVFLAIFLAILAGWYTGQEKAILGIPYVKIYGLIGQLFLNGLSLMVVPLVTASIITGAARMGAENSLGSLGVKTFGFYLLTSSLATLVGLGGFLLFSPGSPLESITIVSSSVSPAINNLALHAQSDAFEKISQILLKLIPANIFSVASQGQMIGLIAFSLLFGLCLPKIDASLATLVTGFWQGVFQVMMKMTQLMMKTMPLGVFALVAKVVASTGIDSIVSVALFVATVILSLLFYALLVLPLLLLIKGINPLLHFRALAPALLTAFSTSSSAATLPTTMECLEKRAGISNRICGFSIPLGTSINMSGGALYMCIASLFIAKCYGVALTSTTFFFVAFMALITSVGIAGIPSASLISVVIILTTIGVPAEGIGLIMAVDRILDMFRTTTNVLGNATCAVLVAHSEGEFIEVD